MTLQTEAQWFKYHAFGSCTIGDAYCNNCGFDSLVWAHGYVSLSNDLASVPPGMYYYDAYSGGNGLINVGFPDPLDPTGTSGLQVFDATGKLVHAETRLPLWFDPSNLRQGVYLFHAWDGERHRRGRFYAH